MHLGRWSLTPFHGNVHGSRAHFTCIHICSCPWVKPGYRPPHTRLLGRMPRSHCLLGGGVIFLTFPGRNVSLALASGVAVLIPGPSLCKRLLSTCYVPGTGLSAGFTVT